MKSKSVHKILCAILVFAMVAAMLPVGVWAEEAEPVTLWDFRTAEYTGQDSYNGLTLTGNFGKHGEAYGLQIKNATIAIPVSGPSRIDVSVGYNWDIAFPDGTAYYDATNSGDKVVSWDYTGEAGTVTLTVGGQCTSYIKYIEITAIEPPVTFWDFRLDAYTGQADYHGLALTGSFNKHGEQYGLQIKNATIEVPVPGACEVQVAVGYNWDITFPDGTNIFDNTNSGDITLRYEHTGEAGTVTITVGGQCTSYIKSIEIVPKAEPVTFWNFRLDEYTGENSYNGLEMTGNLKKHGAQYGLAVSSATISVPVAGACEVKVAVGYNWDITFPDGTQYADKTNSGDIEVIYAHTGEAGTVDITVGSEFTSYIKYIEVIPNTEPVTFWDFRLDEYTGENSYNGLEMTGKIKKHGATYGMAISAATVSVPVAGPSEIYVSVGYNWDITFPDGTQHKDNTDSGDIVVSYIYMGEAGMVDITVGEEFTSYIKYIEVVAKDVSEVPALDPNKIYVWDFGAEQLSGENIVNMLSVDEINSWYAEGTAVGTGVNIATFQSSDTLIGFNDGGKSSTHRLRSTNEALIRYDNKSLTDEAGNVYTGYIYSNSSSTDTVYVTVKVNAGEKVTLAVGSNGGDSLINFESPTGAVTTGEFKSGGAKIQLLTFYPTESGEYKIYSTTEKLVLARITREAMNEIVVSGKVEAPAELSDYTIEFTNTLSGAKFETTVRDGAYTIRLLDGYSYDLALLNANGYVISSERTLSLEKGCGNISADITIEPVDLVTVTGNIVGISEAALAKISLNFAADAIYIPQVTISGSTYTAILEKGMTYALTVGGINDYVLTSEAALCYDADANADIVLEAKPTYAITIAPEGATAADLAGATFTFTNLNEEGYVYTFVGTENIALRDGVYSVKVTGSGSFVQLLTSNVKVNGAAVTKTIRFTDDITEWEFSNPDFTGEGGNFQGLAWTNAVKNKTYLLAKDGIVSIPVKGGCIIKVSACYEYSFYFVSEEESSVGQKSGSTSQIDTYTFIYTGEAGVVELNVLGTSYITKIEVIEPVEYRDTITVGADGDYATINAALNAVKKMARPNNERVTILIQPGNYEEMLVIDIPNVTLKNASENPSIGLTNSGVDIEENAVRITWYYGHGYTYYSMGSDCKFDADILQVNKENGYASFENPGAGTTSGSYWNSTVVVSASGFQANGIIFENSFNQYISEAAANDILVKQGGAKEGSVARADMEVGSTLVQDKAYVERAGALAIANNCAEVYFENCKFISHQDTLYGGTGTTAAFYDCAILGGTDYIYGGMTAVFAKCDLVFNTSENSNDVGYITAPQQSSGRGFLMYNCRVTSTTPGVDTASQYPSKPGYYGRPWASNTGEAVFYNTIIDATDAYWYNISASLIRPDGWLSTLSGESALCGEYGTYEYALGVDNNANRASWAAVFETAFLADGTPITIEAFLGDWNAFEGKDLTIEIPTEKIDNSPKDEPDEPDVPDVPDQPDVPSEPVENHFNSLTDVTPGADKDVIPEGTVYGGFFTVVGTMTQRFSESKGGVYAVEIAKNGTGALEFTIEGEGKVTIVVSSTGGSNTSAVAIINVATGEAVLSAEVTGTSPTELVVEGLKPGTYQIVSPQSDYNRGFRLMTVDVVETSPDSSQTGDLTFLVFAAMLLSASALVVLLRKKRMF